MAILLMLVSCLPGVVQRPIRNWLGADIAPGARLSIFSFVLTRNVRMAPRSKIAPLVVVRVRQLELGEDSEINWGVIVNCLDSPKSCLRLGRFTRIFSFSVLEPSEGIRLGNHVGLGGQCLVFCHGSWPNYLNGAPLSRGPVDIDDEVWIPWRVMILPNTRIGKRAVIGAHSLVRGEVPPESLFSGVPAKAVPAKLWTPMTPELREARLMEIWDDFHAFYEGRFKDRVRLVPLAETKVSPVAYVETVIYSFEALTPGKSTRIDHGIVIDFENLRFFGNAPIAKKFVSFVSTFGVRLSPSSEGFGVVRR